MTLEEQQAKYDAEIAALQAKVSEVIGANKKLSSDLKAAKGQEISQADFDRIELENDTLKAQLKEESKARAATVKDLETVSGQLKAESEAANRSFLDAQLTDALSKAGVVDPDNLAVLRTVFATQAKVTFDGKERKAAIGDKDISTAIAEYPALAKFIPPTQNGGNITHLNGGGGSSDVKIMKNSDFSQLNPKESAAFFASGGRVVDD